MALKVKNPRKNLADILIEKERLNESYDSSSAVSLKTLEEKAEEEGAVEHALPDPKEAEEKHETEEKRPDESIVNETEQTSINIEKTADITQSTKPQTADAAPATEITGTAGNQRVQQSQQNIGAGTGQMRNPVQAETVQQTAGLTNAVTEQPPFNTAGSFDQQPPINQTGSVNQQPLINPSGSVDHQMSINSAGAVNQQPVTPLPVQPPVGSFVQGVESENLQNIPQTAMPAAIPGVNPMLNQLRKPWEEIDDYNPPRKKRGRPYQGYSENTHVQSIYVRNDLYEYIMVNYVGHGRKHSSFNKFVNAAINNYLRQMEENN